MSYSLAGKHVLVTGASTANLSIILIDARQGVVEQSRRHAYIASLLRIPHLVICVNKMDLVGYSEEVFNKIVEAIDIGVEPDVVVKVFRLEFADATEVEGMLSKLIGATKEAAPAGAAGKAARPAAQGDAYGRARDAFLAGQDQCDRSKPHTERARGRATHELMRDQPGAE